MISSWIGAVFKKIWRCVEIGHISLIRLKPYVWLELGENQIGVGNLPNPSKIIFSTQTSLNKWIFVDLTSCSKIFSISSKKFYVLEIRLLVNETVQR